jgi:hypothetical protein
MTGEFRKYKNVNMRHQNETTYYLEKKITQNPVI